MASRPYHRLLAPPKASFFLFGLRGVGKGTWTRNAFPDAYVVDLLDELRHQALLANPGLLGPRLRNVPRSRVVVLDEVQRVPALLNEVHRAIENERRRFVLFCSSARRLRTANTNLVAGRASAQPMYLFVPAELRKDFDLERVLRFGSIPLVWQAADARATLEAYVQFYIREEIRADAQDLKRRTWRGSIRCVWKPPRLNAKSYEYSEGFSTSSMERSRREKERDGRPGRVRYGREAAGKPNRAD